MSGTDIFISYSREDRAAARHFAESFVSEGFSVWWDAALRSGQTFDEVIEQELRAAKAVVVLWSPRSVASRWVRAEATLADRRNKLVPAIIEACDRPIIFELTHAAELADWTGDTSDPRWQALVGDLRNLVEAGTKDQASAKPDAAKLDTAKPDIAESPAKPKSGSAAPTASADALDGADGKSLPPVSIDALMFAASRRREASGRDASGRAVPVAPIASEELEETQFCARLEDFDLHRGDEFHCLQMIDADKPQTRFVVSPLGLKIGRNAPADVILSGSGISRAHCMVELADDRLRILDLNSTNGTYIDEERVARVAFLAIGSVLRVGNISFRHEVHSRAEVLRQDEPVSLIRGPNLRVARHASSS